MTKEKCERFFGTIGETEKEFDGYCQGHDKLEIYYEDLVANMETVCSEIMDFLGVPRHQLEANTLKQKKKTLSETVKNYGELKSHFAGTQWEVFFDG